MSLLSVNEFRKFDAALDGLGLLLAWEFTDAYQYQAPDLIVERLNIGDELTENKLDSRWWASQRSWHVGAGQKRLNFPELSSPYRFLESKGVDVTEKGELTLLRPMTLVKALTNRSPVAPQKTAVTDQQIYIAAGQPNVARVALSGGNLVTKANLGSGTETAKEILDMASDGRRVYLALGADGIHRPPLSSLVTQEAFDSGAWTLAGTNLSQSFDTGNKKEGAASLKLNNTPPIILEEAFDAVTGWSGTSTERAIDTEVKKEGTASLKVTNDTPRENIVREEDFESLTGWTPDPNISQALRSVYAKEGLYALRITHKINSVDTAGSSKTFTAKDFSAKTGFRFWVTPESSRDAEATRIRLGSDATNYFERKLPALSGGVSYEDISQRASDWSAVGSPNWSSISYMKVIGGRGETNGLYWGEDTHFDDFRSFVSIPAAVLEINKAFSRNFATKSRFGVWFRADRALNAGAGAIRMKVNSTKYFERSLPALAANSWLKEISVRTTDWIAVGGAVEGDWASIATLELVVNTTASVWFDALESIGVAASGDASKTHVKNYASVVEFRIWLYSGAALASGDVKIRLEINSTKYAERTVPALSANLWYEDVSARSSWVFVGGFLESDWASIATMRTVLSSAMLTTLNLDDFRSADDEAAFAHWADHDCRVIAWATDAIFGAGIKTGTQWEFFEAAAGAGSSVKKVLPDGWEVTDIVSLGGIVYFSAKQGNLGAIYAWDGEKAFIALDSDGIGLGDVPLVMIPFGGAGMLIGCLRSTGLPGGIGILLRAFPSQAGDLVTDELLTIGTADGKDYGIRAGFSWGRRAYFSWPLADASSSGLGVYMPEEGNGGYARHVYVDELEQVVAAGYFQGRRFVTMDGIGLFAEDISTYLDSGRLLSSLIDLNIDSEKLFVRSEAAYELPDGASVVLEYTLDKGVSYLQAGASTNSSTRFTNLLQAFANRIQYAVTLKKGGTSTPTLFKAGLGGWPRKSPDALHVLTLKTYPTRQFRTGEQQDTRDLGWQHLNELIKRRNTAGILEYQPPWWPFSNEVLKVRIAGIDFGRWEGSGDRHGLPKLFLKEEAA